MSVYVAHDGTLGTGVFGFIGKAVSTVGHILTGDTAIAPKLNLSNIQLPQMPTIKTESRVDFGTIGLMAGGLAAIVLLYTMTKRRAR